MLDQHPSDTMKVYNTKPLLWNPWYLVSTCARVYDTVDERWLTLYAHQTGLIVHYQRVNGTEITPDAHHLVAEVHMPSYRLS